MNWHEYFIRMAELTRQKSKDRSTQVGAVIVGNANEVLSMGFNGFPRGVDDDIEHRHTRPAKYQYTEHAERNAIYNAARNGIRLEGTRLYLDSSPYPCVDCARGVIQAGIKYLIGRDIVFGKPETAKAWIDSCRVGREMLLEADVKIMVLNDDFSIKALEGDWSGVDVDWYHGMDPIHAQKLRESIAWNRRNRNKQTTGNISCLGLDKEA